MPGTRDTKAEYKKYHSSLKAKRERAARNAMRRLFMRKGLVTKGDGKDIDHKNGNPRDNSPGNLQVMDRKRNRGEKRVRDMKGRTA